MKLTKLHRIQLSQKMITNNPQIKDKNLDCDKIFKVNVASGSTVHIEIHIPNNIIMIHKDYVNGGYAKYVHIRDLIKKNFKHHFKNK